MSESENSESKVMGRIKASPFTTVTGPLGTAAGLIIYMLQGQSAQLDAIRSTQIDLVHRVGSLENGFDGMNSKTAGQDNVISDLRERLRQVEGELRRAKRD